MRSLPESPAEPVQADSDDEGEGVVDLHFTRSALDSGGVGEFDMDAGDVLRRAGCGEDQPFILGADGWYDVELNRFLRELNGWGVRSANSIKAYARDVMLFCRFLHEARGGKSIWECGTADLRAYKRVRLHTEGPLQVSVATWRRSVAALDKWVRWSIFEGLLAQEPFRYVDKTVLTPQGLTRVRVNAEQEPDAQAPPIRFVPFEDYLLWRDVGLRGELPDGRPDPRWQGRHGERNALFADVLVYTGMRLGEAASLLVTEVPPLTGARVTGEIRLSPAVTKRGKARSVYLNERTLRGLHHHLEIERGELVARKRTQGTYAGESGTLLVARTGRTGVQLAGGGRFWPHAKIGVEARQRLVGAGVDGAPAEPLWLWLGEDGWPMQPSSWQSVFRRANQRCARFDLALEVHAHTLRHCFAVQMLGLLLRQTLRALGEREDRRLTNAQLKRLLIGNPMRKLQLLLGHSQESTVYAYLDVLDEAQEIVLAALADWDAQAAALGRGAATTPPTPGPTA